MRLIDADALKESMKNAVVRHICTNTLYNTIMAVIDGSPIAERWIPCSERLPNVGQDVLFSVADMYVAEGCIRADGDWTQFRWSAIQRKEEVTAWMPLPTPYKGGGEE